MPKYAQNAAYDLSTFAPRRARPAEEPQPVPRPHVVPRPKKSRDQLRAEERAGARQSLKIFLFSALSLALLGLMIFSQVQITELNHEITVSKQELSIAQSEGTRLDMQLNSLVSMDKIEAYATEKLGMVKQQKHQVEYIDVSGSQNGAAKTAAKP